MQTCTITKHSHNKFWQSFLANHFCLCHNLPFSTQYSSLHKTPKNSPDTAPSSASNSDTIKQLLFTMYILHSAYSESVSWVARPIGEASRVEPKLCVWFLWGNRNKLRSLRAKFWRGPSYHAKGCFQGYQHVILSSIVRLRAFLWHKTVLPPSRGSIRCIITEKHWICHFSRKPEVEIWRKHAQSTFCTRLPIRLLYQ